MYLLFVASLEQNMKLAKLLQEELDSQGQKSEIVNLVDLNLPLYDSKKESEDGIPESIAEVIEKMESAKGYVFVTPEYNYSIPPVLSNFVAWVSRSSDDFRKVFTDRFILLATHSGGGGSDVMQAVRTQLTKLGAFIMPREIITTYQKPYNEQSAKKILECFVAFTDK